MACIPLTSVPASHDSVNIPLIETTSIFHLEKNIQQMTCSQHTKGVISSAVSITQPRAYLSHY